MGSEVWTALIAAGVSVVAGAGTVWVSHRSTVATLRRDTERQQAEFRRGMTERLYERRMATYPGLFHATSAFRRSKMRDAPDLTAHLHDALDKVDDWQSEQGGLILSPRAHASVRRLRDDVSAAIADNTNATEASDTHIAKIWARKNELRLALRDDLGLLFGDEDE